VPFGSLFPITFRPSSVQPSVRTRAEPPSSCRFGEHLGNARQEFVSAERFLEGPARAELQREIEIVPDTPSVGTRDRDDVDRGVVAA
jgi:hypothetical protein